MIVEIVNGVKIYPDGREVCLLKTAKGKREYLRRIQLMAERQNNICSLCPEPFTENDPPTFEHSMARGMGGGRRDDRIEKNSAAHARCNSDKGSRSLEAYRAAKG